jgi:glycosyltransferase involved in cell wall biosynthesis
VEFNVYGPIEDGKYWQECQQLIQGLPTNVTVNYRGELTHPEVQGVVQCHELFFLPTCGENFGHVIAEALSAGCPVLISDQTPWRGLREAGVGWDLPLAQPAKFREAIQECLAMTEETFQDYSRRARAYAPSAGVNAASVERNREMFCQVLSHHQSDLRRYE